MDEVMDRYEGVVRPYSQDDVKKLRDRFGVDYTIARKMSKKLWKMMSSNKDPVRALGAMNGNQAMQQVKAGLESIYVSGWQVAACANSAGQMYPDQSLYPVNSVPLLVKQINNTLRRCDQIDNSEGKSDIDWQVPMVADAEAGFGGHLNVFELTKAMIEAGAAGIHLEDQLSSEKKCGHLNSKCLVPTSQFIKSLVAARLAADVCETPTVIIARTDAESAGFITSNIDPYDRDFISNDDRTQEGFYRLSGDSMKRCIARGLAYAPYCDAIWMETSTPNLDQARKFAEAIHEKFPGKMLAYNCSPSFNWEAKLDKGTIAKFQEELGKMGYKYQFVTLAGFHSINMGMFDLAKAYKESGMAGYSDLQQREFAAQEHGFTAIKHQHEVGTGYFDSVRGVINGGDTSMSALAGSTEDEQF
jgi:isocitrate lyase